MQHRTKIITLLYNKYIIFIFSEKNYYNLLYFFFLRIFHIFFVTLYKSTLSTFFRFYDFLRKLYNEKISHTIYILEFICIQNFIEKILTLSVFLKNCSNSYKKSKKLILYRNSEKF